MDVMLPVCKIRSPPLGVDAACVGDKGEDQCLATPKDVINE